jgi:hypothetical protein
MSKVVKLTQSDIESIVTNIVNEQETGTYQLPDGEVTYDTPEDKDYSGELAEIDFSDSSEKDLGSELDEVDFSDSEGENDFESGVGEPVPLALAQGDDGYMYAIDPETKEVISRIKM